MGDDDCYSVKKILIEAGADVNLHNDLTPTPLIVAIEANKYDIRAIQLLLESGADPNIVLSSSIDAQFWAVIRNRIDVMKLLVEYNADTSRVYKLTDMRMPFAVYGLKNKPLENGLLNKGLNLGEIAKYLNNEDMYNYLISAGNYY